MEIHHHVEERVLDYVLVLALIHALDVVEAVEAHVKDLVAHIVGHHAPLVAVVLVQ